MSTHPFLIVIPAYNEQDNIASVLEGLLTARLEADILIVNDGSRDSTEDVASRYPVKVISHPVNLGYGAALQTGYKYATAHRYSFVLQFDSDGQHSPADLPRIMNELSEDAADIVMGSRFVDESGSFKTGLVKGAGIRFFRFVILKLTGTRITDPTSGLRGLC